MQKLKAVRSQSTLRCHRSSRKYFTAEALQFLVELHTQFDGRRRELLERRARRQREIDAGARPAFLPETESIRKDDWTVAPIPSDLQDRRVEITGPVDRKMIINALNSGASCFMADLRRLEFADLAEQSRRADQSARRDPRHDRFHQSRRQEV